MSTLPDPSTLPLVFGWTGRHVRVVARKICDGGMSLAIEGSGPLRWVSLYLPRTRRSARLAKYIARLLAALDEKAGGPQ